MQKLIFILVWIAVSCNPVHGQSQAARQTVPAAQTPARTTLSPTLSSALPASEALTAITPMENSATASVSFSGAVQIAGGSCCIGGFDGETIQAEVSFSAASPFGRVSQMRVTRCSTDADMESAVWEPFVDSKSFPVPVVINWTGFTLCAQYQDEYGNLSPVYRDDISVEGMPRGPLVNPTEWYPQIQCFAETEVHPGPGEIVSGETVTFRWPDKNHLPEGLFYKVFAYGASDHFSGLVSSGQTRGTSITLPIDPERAEEIGWYVTLVDANGTLIDHGQCSSFSASLLTVDPPEGLKAIFFQYQP